MTAEWVLRMRDASVLRVAQELGHNVAPPRGASGGAVYGCPSCGAERRHPKTRDKRGAVGLKQNGAGWRCFQCDSSGGAIDFVAFALRGACYSELGDAGKDAVREWCVKWSGTSATRRPMRPPANPPETPPKYPPVEHVMSLWAACTRIDEDPEAATYLRARGIDPVALSDTDVARALPRNIATPPGAWYRRTSWAVSGHRIITPLRDARGRLRSLLARCIRPDVDDDDWRKSLFFAGERGGLVMACPLACQVLERAAVPAWWPRDRPLEIVACEGDSDFVATVVGPGIGAAGIRWADADECAPAIIGVESGAWRGSIADRIPDGAIVIAATDDDEAGDRYARAIGASLQYRVKAGRVEMWRWRPARERRE